MALTPQQIQKYDEDCALLAITEAELTEAIIKNARDTRIRNLPLDAEEQKGDTPQTIINKAADRLIELVKNPENLKLFSEHRKEIAINANSVTWSCKAVRPEDCSKIIAEYKAEIEAYYKNAEFTSLSVAEQKEIKDKLDKSSYTSPIVLIYPDTDKAEKFVNRMMNEKLLELTKKTLPSSTKPVDEVKTEAKDNRTLSLASS